MDSQPFGRVQNSKNLNFITNCHIERSEISLVFMIVCKATIMKAKYFRDRIF
ncbi:hypothetical protein [Helicobacter sp.]|uniref:hypothetical protein n=1 Tax=Helicobacter sp. TaxID=218 RepID=UPI0012BCA4C7|nr:hypothetical protein [Helicobacter sp.]